MNPPITLQNWAVVYNPDASPYTPPELLTAHLVGDVQNHPRFPDGKNITTSSIIGRSGNLIRTKSGSEYELGEVSADYEKNFPNARERFFSTVNDLGKM